MKAIKKDKEGHYLMVIGSIQEEDITIVKIDAPNIGAPRYIQQIRTDIIGKNNGNTITAGEFNTQSHQWTDTLDRKSVRQQRS